MFFISFMKSQCNIQTILKNTKVYQAYKDVMNAWYLFVGFWLSRSAASDWCTSIQILSPLQTTDAQQPWPSNRYYSLTSCVPLSICGFYLWVSVISKCGFYVLMFSLIKCIFFAVSFWFLLSYMTYTVLLPKHMFVPIYNLTNLNSYKLLSIYSYTLSNCLDTIYSV